MLQRAEKIEAKLRHARELIGSLLIALLEAKAEHAVLSDWDHRVQKFLDETDDLLRESKYPAAGKKIAITLELDRDDWLMLIHGLQYFSGMTELPPISQRPPHGRLYKILEAIVNSPGWLQHIIAK